MTWFLTIIFILTVTYFLLFRLGNLNFWKLASRYPNEIYKLMREMNRVWLIDPDYKVTSEWTGPFLLYVPSIQR